MHVFEGAPSQLAEAERLYGVVDASIRTWQFSAAPSELISRADALLDRASAAIARASPRASRDELAAARRLSRTAERARRRRVRRAEYRARLLQLDPQSHLRALVDALQAAGGKDPLTLRRWARFRILFVVSTLFLVFGGTPVAAHLLAPPVLIAWCAFALTAILPAYSLSGRTRLALTVFALVPLAWILWLGRHDLEWASVVPLAAATLIWAGAAAYRHAS